MQANLSTPDRRGPFLSNLRGWLALLVLLAGVALAMLANRLPVPAPVTAPPGQFSAGRAMNDVAAIATRPHPIGSPEIEDTRRYLVERMARLGLDPQVRARTAVVQRHYFGDMAIGARVQNIVGELKGSDPTLPAVLLMAHYDTVPLSPGAGDDTSGVAVALEVARALKTAGRLKRSVIFLFTDGEEAGLLGSTAFFENDPLRHRAGLIVNLEARGDSGKALMFQTSANNRHLIEAYRRSVASPSADSLMVTIYKRMPNDTDLTAALEQGFAGMNFAFVGHQLAYHTMLSTAERLNPGSIQHMGDQVLPVVRNTAEAESLDQARDDMVFADLFGGYLIAYPAWLGWILAVVAIGAGWTVCAMGIARGAVNWRDALRGAGGLLTLLLAIATILMLAVRLAALLLSGVASPYALVGQFDWLLPAAILLGLGTSAVLLRSAVDGRRRAVALALGVAGAAGALLGTFSLVPLLLGIAAGVLAFVSFGRGAALTGWFAGALSLLGVFALVAQLLLPNGAHALVWPLLLLVPALALLVFAPARVTQPTGLLVIALPAALVAGMMAKSGYEFFLLGGPTLPAIITPFILVAVIAVVPLIWSLRRLALVGAAGVAAGLLLCIAAGIAGRTPTAERPEMVEAFYLADLDKGSALWASGKLDRAGWVKAMLTRDGGTPSRKAVTPLFKDDLWVAEAKPAPFTRPKLTLAVTGEGAARQIRVDAANANGGRYMRLLLKPSADLTGVRLMDQPIDDTLKAGNWAQLTFHASGGDAVRLSAPVAGRPGQLDVMLVEVRDDPPSGRAPIALPPNTIPFRRSGDSIITVHDSVKW